MHLPLTPRSGRALVDGAPELAPLVEARRHDAAERLTAAAGSSSLCTLSRSGTPRPAVKYLEGAAAALSDVHRALHDRPDVARPATADSASALTLVDDVRERWAARRQQATALSPSWQAYLDGGVDALDDLVATEPRTDAAAASATGAPPGSAPASLTVTAPARPVPPPALSTKRWRPSRRTLATVVLAPLLFAALVTTGGGWAPLAAPLWTVLVALTATVGAATLASYLPLPGQGLRPNVGCSPCAAVSAMTVLAAAWLLGSAPFQPTMAVVALAAASFGLVQRVTGAGTTCAT